MPGYQNFAKASGIKYISRTGQEEYVWQRKELRRRGTAEVIVSPMARRPAPVGAG